jgi:hypothetical protein
LELELFGREVLTAMDHLEELPQRLTQPFPIGTITVSVRDYQVAARGAT